MLKGCRVESVNTNEFIIIKTDKALRKSCMTNYHFGLTIHSKFRMTVFFFLFVKSIKGKKKRHNQLQPTDVNSIQLNAELMNVPCVCRIKCNKIEDTFFPQSITNQPFCLCKFTPVQFLIHSSTPAGHIFGQEYKKNRMHC